MASRSNYKVITYHFQGFFHVNLKSYKIKDVSDNTDSQVDSGYLFYLLERNIVALFFPKNMSIESTH